MSPLATIPLLCLLALGACRSAEGWSEKADEEVYPILAGHLEALGSETGFTVEPPVDPLRARLEQGLEAGPLELDLVTSLRIAAENSREWQDQRERLFRTALDLTLERWNFSTQPDLAAAAAVSGAGGEAQRHELLSNFGLFRILGIGTRITADVGIDLIKDLSSGNGWDALSHLSLNITQPILRGFGRDIVLEPLTQAERDVLYEARRYERFRRTFAVSIAQQFFQVLERMDRLGNEEANYANLKALRERNEAMGEAGRMTDVQVDQARQDELSAEDTLVAVRRDLEAALDDFKFTLGLPIETEVVLTAAGMRSLESWQGLEIEFDEDQAVSMALERRLDHAIVLDQEVDAERGVRVAADALRLGLDLGATVAGTSAEGRPFALRSDDMVWRLSLGLDVPIDKIPERNAYRSAEIALEAARRESEASADRIAAQLRDSLRNLEAAQASYRIQSGSVLLAERRVESAALNLDAGRVSTRDVLDAQESLLSAQNTLAGALTDTILAGLFLYRDMELLEVDAEGIRVRFEDAPEPRP